jgi:hypothetical protein
LQQEKQRGVDHAQGAMTRSMFTAAIALLCGAVAATSPPVTFESSCECSDNHGKHRWAVKNDPSLPPTDANAIQAVTPSDMFSWPGPDVYLTPQSERIGIENKWFALIGRVVALKVETDGDIHIAFKVRPETNRRLLLLNYRRNRSGVRFVVMDFSWTRTRFPFHTSSTKKPNITNPPISTVIGKAFFDIGHAPKDQSNRRRYLPGYAAWEIHPVMELEVQ